MLICYSDDHPHTDPAANALNAAQSMQKQASTCPGLANSKNASYSIALVGDMKLNHSGILKIGVTKRVMQKQETDFWPRPLSLFLIRIPAWIQQLLEINRP